MTGSFTVKKLRASLILPQGNFPGTNNNTLVIDSFRTAAKLEAAGGNFTTSCVIQIWGMRQVDMNAVTVLFGQDGNAQSIAARAILVLEVGTDTGWLQIFTGQFQEASPDYSGSPEVYLAATAATGYGQQILSAPPTSFKGSAPIATIASQLSQQLGFPFENNGVTGALNDCYLAGSLMQQFRQLVEAAKADFYFDPQGTLILTPRGQGRQGRTAVVVSPPSGMVLSPTLNRFGCTVKVLFDPAIALGAPIQVVNSQVPGTNGLWFPRTMRHDLDTIKPSGQWFTTLELSPFAAAAA